MASTPKQEVLHRTFDTVEEFKIFLELKISQSYYIDKIVQVSSGQEYIIIIIPIS